MNIWKWKENNHKNRKTNVNYIAPFPVPDVENVSVVEALQVFFFPFLNTPVDTVFYPNKDMQLRNWIWSLRKENPKAEEAEQTARFVFNSDPSVWVSG